jgi:glycosyltransferase involved in cell wall biosynthesis
VIDQLRIGWYGMLAIESMALAKPVVVHLDAQAAAGTEEAFGLELPLVRATEETLADVLAGLVEQRDSLPELGRRSREYAEHVHAHTKVAQQVLEIYERVMPISS